MKECPLCKRMMLFPDQHGAGKCDKKVMFEHADQAERDQLLKRIEAANLRADQMERERDQLRVAAKGAIAALSQNKTFPADVEAAKSFLSDALTGGAK